MDNTQWPAKSVIFGRIGWLVLFLGCIAMLAFQSTRAIGAVILLLMWGVIAHQLNKHVIWKTRN